MLRIASIQGHERESVGSQLLPHDPGLSTWMLGQWLSTRPPVLMASVPEDTFFVLFLALKKIMSLYSSLIWIARNSKMFYLIQKILNKYTFIEDVWIISIAELKNYNNHINQFYVFFIKYFAGYYLMNFFLNKLL